MAIGRTFLLAGVVLAGSLHAQTQNNLFSGFSIRLGGGLTKLSNLDGLNDGITGMNHYFGVNGTWGTDAQGDLLDGVDWAPLLHVPHFSNSTQMGISLEKAMAFSDYTRLIVGLEYNAGNTETSNLYEFLASISGSGGEGRIWAQEKLELTNTLFTARYSLKDLNYPLHAHLGLGVGFASLTSTGLYVQEGPVILETDPSFGEVDVQQQMVADYDGDTISGRLFVGFEWLLGPTSLLLDLGYDYLDFGNLEGSTTSTVRDFYGDMIEYELQNVPDGRFEMAPAISATLQHVRDQRIREARTGIPEQITPVDVDNQAQQIEYDLSGGFVRFSVAYHF